MDLSDGFHLGDWQVLPLEGRIVAADGGDSRRVRRKAMDVLCVLAARAGQVVERDDLLAEVWGRTAVTDEPLTATIGELRRLLGERSGSERRYIETIPKRGYRLLCEALPLIPRQEPDTEAPARPALVPPPVDRVTHPPYLARQQPRARFGWRAVLAVSTIAIVSYLVYQELSAPVPVPERSIAVLPFDDLSPAGDQAYLADGVAEELVSLLTRIPTLQVAARNSAFSFRDQALDVHQIASRLKVAHVLIGSVQRVGDQVRVTVQLVDARAGYQRWSDTYHRTLDDIFAIQAEIAGRVADQLRVQLVGRAAQIRETDTRAYTLYLKARHIGRQHTEQGLTQAATLYREALEIDADYLPAWNELAGTYFNLVGFALMPREEGYRLAREAAYQALARDPDYAPAHDRLGWLALYEDSDLVAAAAHYGRALALEPDDDVIRSNAALVALAIGRMDDAIALLEDGAIRDPVSAVSHANLANAYLLARKYTEAERSMRNALTLSPQYAAGHFRLARILLARRDLTGASAALDAEPLEAGRLLGRAFLGNAIGAIEDADAAIADLETRFGNRAAGNIAQVYAQRGDLEQAFEWLETEYRTNGTAGFLEYRWDPVFDPIRADPRWADLLDRIGFGDDQLAEVEFPRLTALRGKVSAK